MSEVQRVRLSLRSCMMRVESLKKKRQLCLFPPCLGYALVGFLGKGVELGNSVVESLFGKVASPVGGVENLIAIPGVSRRS